MPNRKIERNIVVQTRVNIVEYTICKRRMELLNINTMSEFVRQACLYGKLFYFKNFDEMTEALVENSNQLFKIGININQIAHRVNSNPEAVNLYSEDVDYLKKEMKTIKENQINLTKKIKFLLNLN